MFHTLYVLICSPHDILAPEPGFNDSDAFILAHEHALRTTAWLKVLLTIPSNPVFNTGLFQFCVLKTGLIHLAFVRSLGRKETGSALAIEALEHVHIHTSAFIAGQRKYKWRITGDGQEGSGGPGQLTFWYRSWLQALAAPQFGAV